MKAMFIAYNQAYTEDIVELLAAHGQRGFTRWEGVEGKGSFNGFPRFGSHAWPEMNHALLVMMEDEKVAQLLAALESKDKEAPDQGLRAFNWSIESFY